MTRKGYLHLVASFREAREAAERLADWPDGGTCNLDSLVVKLPRGTRERTVQEAAVEAGFTASKSYSGGFTLHIPTAGQAERHTQQLKAARKILNEKGIDAHIRYVLD